MSVRVDFMPALGVIQISVDGQILFLPRHEAATFLSQFMVVLAASIPDSVSASGGVLPAPADGLTSDRAERSFRETEAENISRKVDSVVLPGPAWHVTLLARGEEHTLEVFSKTKEGARREARKVYPTCHIIHVIEQPGFSALRLVGGDIA